MAWSWDCEDDEELLGVVLFLERAGARITIERAESGGRVEVDEADRELAARLRERLRAHHVRKVDAARGQALDRRDRLGRRTLWVGGAALLAAIVAWLVT